MRIFIITEKDIKRVEDATHTAMKYRSTQREFPYLEDISILAREIVDRMRRVKKYDLLISYAYEKILNAEWEADTTARNRMIEDSHVGTTQHHKEGE